MRLDHLLSKEYKRHTRLFSFERPRAYSSVGLERTPDKREVGGSNPPRPTKIEVGSQKSEVGKGKKFALRRISTINPTSDILHPASVFRGGVAQLGERLPCKQEVGGSNPLFSTKLFFEKRISRYYI
ncbi:hypothetical protein SSCH_1860001 [Syntrophaceticus schinkii]|uniref:Uncharacterized protein n=1 Tax=Syntrophaceticus schinkii TaxID=499207 RepID=A0A0B7ML71_9FIRM|nr:hypothetical protein SSCH_1860001 [Syntrophaceticus schinkii]